MPDIWIVNDYLTCVPDTRTFWHMLLEIDGTVDKTGVPFPNLAKNIEDDPDNCDILIRNATFFRPINRNCKQIVFLQDFYGYNEMQYDTVMQSDHVVFNSEHTKNQFLLETEMSMIGPISYKSTVIPIGINTELFSETGKKVSMNDNKPVGIFVGDYNQTKGTALFHEICRRRPDVNFIYVSKRGRKIRLPNVQNFPGGKNERVMSWLYNSADFCIMCSPQETLHLASVEAAACNKPVLGYTTGWLKDYFSPRVGIRLSNRLLASYLDGIDRVINGTFSPREHIMTTPFVWDKCKTAWNNCIKEVLND